MKRWAHGGSEWAWKWRGLVEARVSLAVAVALVALYGLVALAGGVDRLEAWYLALGLRRADVLAGRFWQVATHALIHGNGWHVGLNAAMLWLLGSRVERMLGRTGTAKALALGVLGGAFGHLALVPGEGASMPLVGASGACMALLLVVTTLSPDSRMFPLPVSGRNLGLGVLLAEGGFALINPDLGIPGLSALGSHLSGMGWGTWFRIGHACHFGGGLAGWLYARTWLRNPVSLADLREQRRRSERN